jgi:hypothetical protein
MERGTLLISHSSPFTVGNIAHSKEKTIRQYKQSGAVAEYDRTPDELQEIAVDKLGRMRCPQV